MNYYEELGVSPNASIEEIRRAYKEMARLLHPDRHQDRSVRLAAERQMMRLNSIYRVLSDPSQRARYDAHLAFGDHGLVYPEAQTGVGRLRQARPLWAWIAGLAAVAACLSIYFSLSHPVARDEAFPIQRAGRQAIETAIEPVGAEVRQRVPLILRPAAPGPAKTAEYAREGTRLGPSPVVAPAPMPEEGSDSYPTTLSRAEPLPRMEGAANPSPLPKPPETSPKRQLTGIWLYVPRKLTEMPITAYLPEYIELRLSEQDGQIHGRYQARYRTTSSTHWPEVSFEFRGASGSESFQWTGAGGARGEICLKPLGDGELEASWWAHQTSQRLSLASGTAVLIRERTP